MKLRITATIIGNGHDEEKLAQVTVPIPLSTDNRIVRRQAKVIVTEVAETLNAAWTQDQKKHD